MVEKNKKSAIPPNRSPQLDQWDDITDPYSTYLPWATKVS